MTAVRASRRSFELFVTLVERQLRLRAKRSWLSSTWPVFAPFLLMLLYVYVFKRIFSVQIDRYPEFLLCGLLPWAFVTQALSRSQSALSTEQDMIRKAPFPHELLPLSAVGAYALNLLVSLGLFTGWLAVTGHLSYAVLAALAVPVASLVLLVMGLSMLVALIDVYNHDLRLVLNNLLTVWLFLTPVVYRPAMAPRAVRSLHDFDPLSLIVVETREILYYGRFGSARNMAVMVVVCAGVFAMARALFRRWAVELPKDV